MASAESSKSGNSQKYFYIKQQHNEENENFDSGTAESDSDFTGSTELPAASVIAMAQSVGVNLNEEVASALGELTIRKLRGTTLLAMQFSQHENSHGLRVVDFSNAEKVINSISYGHNCLDSTDSILPILSTQICVMDEGPEIDLYHSLSSSKISEIIVEDLDPTFFVHYASYNDKLTQQQDQEEGLDNIGHSFEINDIPLLNSLKENNVFNEPESNFSELSDHDDNDDEVDSGYHNNLPSCTESQVQNHVSRIVENGFDEDDEIQSEVDKIVSTLHANGYTFSNVDIEENISKPEHKFAIEWLDYLKVFVKCFLSYLDDGNFHDKDLEENEKDNESETNNFQLLLKDLGKHGAFPLLNVICDLFRDYIRGFLVPVTLPGLKRIISVIDAFLFCPSSLNSLQMQKLSSLLIELVILPPSSEIQNHLTNVFMKILKQYDELLTWTCSYITEVLKQFMETIYETLSEEAKSVLYGALCLANGLEILKIQVAQEFGWHSSIISFIKTQSHEFKLQKSSLADGYVEEEILNFCRNFLYNYKTRVSSEETETMQQYISDVYGEKLIPHLSNQDSFVAAPNQLKSHKSKPVVQGAVSLTKDKHNTVFQFRKGYWKNRKISIPYRKSKLSLTSTSSYDGNCSINPK